MIEKDGETYLSVETRNAGKINSLKRWDTAFWIYAAIFSQANPGRAAEIWQYVHVIHTAASSYDYDITFRQLMSNYPNRSWAKTYMQSPMLQCSCRLHIPRSRTPQGSNLGGSH